MQYIMHTRFKGRVICGEVNIPAKTPLIEKDGIIYYDEFPLFVTTSQNAFDYACVDEDDKGMERGNLTKFIIKLLRTIYHR